MVNPALPWAGWPHPHWPQLRSHEGAMDLARSILLRDLHDARLNERYRRNSPNIAEQLGLALGP